MINHKEITVLLPIQVPNSEYCYNEDNNVECMWFWCKFKECTNGFIPIKDGKNYKKPKACLELLWQENVVDSKNLGKETLIR